MAETELRSVHQTLTANLQQQVEALLENTDPDNPDPAPFAELLGQLKAARTIAARLAGIDDQLTDHRAALRDADEMDHQLLAASIDELLGAHRDLVAKLSSLAGEVA